MIDVFIYIVALLVTVPVLFLFISYFIAMKWHRLKKKAVRQSTQSTVPFLVLAIHILLLVLFEENFVSWIIIFLLVILSLSVIIQYKIYEEIQLRRAFKGFLRLSFLLLLMVYVGLIVYGLVDSVFL
ncbi:DUF3397 domain-containing protein [Halobacillus shinanisalinarum]|uniref:DUF3397 domain-containing protein n=1 Tax=Halobacillus shinanisalinarum TaxID=2932258 RepID=A0ABY4GYT2_9BACI|nr:DUF3397 domain-containing protein [Halobacillus shinanisalinarum]UOQ93075.1 DUF3397 domain-containing protein [Halobacillus shinanisalinarum]